MLFRNVKLLALLAPLGLALGACLACKSERTEPTPAVAQSVAAGAATTPDNQSAVRPASNHWEGCQIQGTIDAVVATCGRRRLAGRAKVPSMTDEDHAINTRRFFENALPGVRSQPATTNIVLGSGTPARASQASSQITDAEGHVLRVTAMIVSVALPDGTGLLITCGGRDESACMQDVQEMYTRPPAVPPSPGDRETLLDARKGFHTRIVTQEGYTRDGPVQTPPAGLLERTTYRSPAGELGAYITPRPAAGGRRPALVWAHGGFGGIGDWLWKGATPSNDQTAAAFREAGLVVMYPSWRGENDNPGQFELYYGEVDDLLAAVDHVATLPWVDPARVYLAGHSSGGALVMLAAAASDRFRAAFAFGPDLGFDEAPAGLRAMRLMGRIAVPFDVERVGEARLRSAAYFVGAIRRPTFYFEGEKNVRPALPLLVRLARDKGAPFTAFGVEGGNHWTILHPLTRLVAERILADVGSTCDIRITKQDVASAFARRPK